MSWGVARWVAPAVMALCAAVLLTLVAVGRQHGQRNVLLADSVREQVAAAHDDALVRYKKLASQHEDAHYADAEERWKKMDSHRRSKEELYKSLGAQGKELKEDFPSLEKNDALVYRNGLNSWGREYDGGMGTFPGGQYTGGNSEFAFERVNHLAKHVSPRENIARREMEKQVWSAVGGPCLDKLKVDEMEDCVSKELALDPSSRQDMKALDIADTEWHALRRPATEEVANNGQYPALEDVVAFNGRKDQNIDMEAAKSKMATLQKALDKVVNHRNMDTEHLTQDSNDLWMAHTRPLCCVDQFDTACNTPCWI